MIASSNHLAGSKRIASSCNFCLKFISIIIYAFANPAHTRYCHAVSSGLVLRAVWAFIGRLTLPRNPTPVIGKSLQSVTLIWSQPSDGHVLAHAMNVSLGQRKHRASFGRTRTLWASVLAPTNNCALNGDGLCAGRVDGVGRVALIGYAKAVLLLLHVPSVLDGNRLHNRMGRPSVAKVEVVECITNIGQHRSLVIGG